MRRWFGFLAMLAMLPYLLLGQAAFGAGYVLTNGPIWGADGTVSAPQFTFAADDNSGMYRIGADNIGIGVGGAKVIDIGTAGVGVTGTLITSGLATFNAGATVASGQTLTLNGALISGTLASGLVSKDGVGTNIDIGNSGAFTSGETSRFRIYESSTLLGFVGWDSTTNSIKINNQIGGGSEITLGGGTINLSTATQIGADAGGFLHRIIGKDAAGNLGNYGLQISATFAGSQTLQFGTDQTNSYSWLRVPSGSLKIYDASAEVADFDGLAINLLKPVTATGLLTVNGAGSTSTTSTQIWKNSATTTLGYVQDDGVFSLGIDNSSVSHTVHGSSMRLQNTSEIADTSKLILIRASNSGTNVASSAAQSAVLQLNNTNNTAGNYTSVVGVNSAGQVGPLVSNVNVDHTTPKMAWSVTTRNASSFNRAIYAAETGSVTLAPASYAGTSTLNGDWDIPDGNLQVDEGAALGPTPGGSNGQNPYIQRKTVAGAFAATITVGNDGNIPHGLGSGISNFAGVHGFAFDNSSTLYVPMGQGLITGAGFCATIREINATNFIVRNCGAVDITTSDTYYLLVDVR